MSRQYRVINAPPKDPEPSGTYDHIQDAVEARDRRLERYPEDGPQIIEGRTISEWEDIAR